jgi:hypothetical protein
MLPRPRVSALSPCFTENGRVTGFLSLAAAPTFAAMAVLTGVVETGSPAAICSMSASPLTGMVLMYALMSAFHTGPWLGRFAG